MSNGEKSNLPLNAKYGGNNWSEVKINPAGAVVKKVIMWGNYEFGGV